MTDELDPEMCSITLKDLVKIGNDAKQKYGLKKYETMTMHDINALIIKPECEKTGKPYSLSLSLYIQRALK